MSEVRMIWDFLVWYWYPPPKGQPFPRHTSSHRHTYPVGLQASLETHPWFLLYEYFLSTSHAKWYIQHTCNRACSAQRPCLLRRWALWPGEPLSFHAQVRGLLELEQNPWILRHCLRLLTVDLKGSDYWWYHLSVTNLQDNGSNDPCTVFSSWYSHVSLLPELLAAYIPVQWNRQPSEGLSLMCRSIEPMASPPWSRIWEYSIM